VRASAILTAAGSGTRLGSADPKALVRLGADPLVVHAARRLRAAGIEEIVVTCPSGRDDDIARAVAEVSARCVPGGASRQASVAAGLAALGPDADVVLVHDAARPLASPALIGRLLERLAAGDRAVIPGLAVIDTIKRVSGGVVSQTLDRTELVAVQTPQAFARDLLVEVHAAGAALAAAESTAVSDDAGLVERFSDVAVSVVAGEDQAMKITTRVDLALAEAMLASGQWS
jgi:2-C-methyl-D-erythritol 4-phosphate cytidylyltransferase